MKTEYKYYSKLRPVSMGTYPKRGLLRFENFDRREYVDEISWWAWGVLYYDRKLTVDEILGYDLEPAEVY